MKELRALILAAGRGSRMKSSLPKVLHKVSGQPIIRYVMDAARAAGSLKTYIIVGHMASDVQNALGEDNTYILQKKLLGTADAVKTAKDKLKGYNGDLLILCGDTPLLRASTIKALVKKHRATKAACTFLTACVHDPKGYGRIIRDDHGLVVAIREEKDAIGAERNIAEINVGVYCFKSKELFKALQEIKVNKKKKEFYLTDIVELFNGQDVLVETVESEDSNEGLGVNSKEDLAAAEGVIRQNILRKFMADGVTIVDPKTTYIDANVKIGMDTKIRPFTFIEENVIIGKECLIGPFARIRPGTRIADKVEVGNFTEVSRTKIGNKSLVKHFSFLGDAQIGCEVNIGAGTITANFDGREKHITKISDNAFIGSGSVIVAPAKVGKRAVLGAGCVLTSKHNVPEGAVAIGVPARIMKGKKRE